MQLQKANKRQDRAEGAAEKNPGERGFTLIETMIAGVIMTVVSLGTMSLFVYSTIYNSNGNTRAIAMMVAQKQMEQFRNVPFTDASLNAISGAQSTLTSEGLQCTVTTTIVNTSSTLKTITIQVASSSPVSKPAQGSSVTLVIQRSANQAGPNLGP